MKETSNARIRGGKSSISYLEHGLLNSRYLPLELQSDPLCHHMCRSLAFSFLLAGLKVVMSFRREPIQKWFIFSSTLGIDYFNELCIWLKAVIESPVILVCSSQAIRWGNPTTTPCMFYFQLVCFWLHFMMLDSSYILCFKSQHNIFAP